MQMGDHVFLDNACWRYKNKMELWVMIKTINCMVTMETRLKHDGYFFVDVWHDFINLMIPVGEEFPVYDRSVYMAQMTPQRRNIQQGIYLDIYIYIYRRSPDFFDFFLC
jgi:hypothetical protein